MKPSSGILALCSFALCLPVLAQDTTVSSPSAAQPASVAAASTNTVGLTDIRIVRLSQVRGTVTIDRHIGRGYEEAFANVPITGGTKLHTDVGLAEVEFEDNSTFRLTPDTEVEFTLLKRAVTGPTITAVNVLHGMVFANLTGTKGNTFTITAGKASVQMNPNSHIRLSMDGLKSNISVLDGSVEFTDPFAYTSTIKHKQSLDFDAAGGRQPEFAKMENTAFDEWDKNGNDYQKLYASQRMSGGAGLYGSSDLNYYGSFSNFGCGNMWRPYFASASWSPYDNGMWAYYGSNVGYSWVSPYPWGWLPFHSGNWVNCGGAGWGWQPGSSFVGLQNVAAGGGVPVGGVPVGGAAVGGRGIPTAPLPPRGGGPTMVPVNTHPLAVSSVSAPGTFTFRKDSAGLGVPRDFGELRSVSSDVAHHGQVNTEIERGVIGPGPTYAHRGANGNMNGNPNAGPNAARANGHDYTPGSRSVGTFTRTDARGNGANGVDGWSHVNNGMNNGMNNGAPNGMGANNNGMNGGGAQGGGAPGASPRGTWQRPEGGSGVPRPQAAPPSSGGGAAPQGAAASSHK